jgi:hypothetical protein
VGKRHSRYKTPDGTSPLLELRPAFFFVLAASGLFQFQRYVVLGMHSPTESRLQRNGAKGFLRATKGGVLGAMPFVVEAVLWTTVAVSVVLVMYMLVRRWL